MILLRFLLSIGSYGVGTAGGIFAPLLVIGGLLVLLIGNVSQHVFSKRSTRADGFRCCGYGCHLCKRCTGPLTGIVLMIEMTGHYELILPLMVTSFTAAVAADELYVPPIYDALLESQLSVQTAKRNN
jgi:CIC family chloride channel protein